MQKKIQEYIKKSCQEKLLIGVSGIMKSGKTGFANELYDFFKDKGREVQIVSIKISDDLVEAALKTKNPSKYYYENAIDKKKLISEIKEAEKVNDIVIVEGILLFMNTIDIDFDIKVWVDASFKTCKERFNETDKTVYDELFVWLMKQHYSIDNPKAKADIVHVNDELLDKGPEVLIDLSNDNFSMDSMEWLYEPENWDLQQNGLLVETDAVTDFWQRTHYGFRNDNAHMLYISTDKDFVMTTEVEFSGVHQFDQCGLAVRIDEDNWIKTSIEYELANPPKLGAVVTNLGYSDWSTEELDQIVNKAIFRITREGHDYKVEAKIGNDDWRQLRICHLHSKEEIVKCGIYCCSPINKGYKVLFKEFKVIENIQ